MVRRVCVCACECRTRKRTTQGANQQQNSLYRFYMDDSPGLTITPLVLRFCICLIYVPISTHVLLGWNVADVFFPLSLSLFVFTGRPDHVRRVHWLCDCLASHRATCTVQLQDLQRIRKRNCFFFWLKKK